MKGAASQVRRRKQRQQYSSLAQEKSVRFDDQQVKSSRRGDASSTDDQGKWHISFDASSASTRGAGARHTGPPDAISGNQPGHTGDIIGCEG